MKIAKAIKELRRRLKYTQQQLAFETGLSVRGIAGYEIETREPEPAPLVRLATVAARAGHRDIAHVFLTKLADQLRLRDLSTGLLQPAAPQSTKTPVIPGDKPAGGPGLLLLAFQDPGLNGPARAFFEAAARYLWGSERARKEAREFLGHFEQEALKRWGRHRIIYRETENGVEYQASDGTVWEEVNEE